MNKSAKVEAAHPEPPPVTDIRVTIRIERPDGDSFDLCLSGQTVTTKSLIVTFRAAIDFLTAQLHGKAST